jgi:hypothetical protein
VIVQDGDVKGHFTLQPSELGRFGLSDLVPDLFGRQSVRSNDEGKVRIRVQDLSATVHHVPLVSRTQNAIQEDRSLSNLRSSQERLSNVLVGLGVRTSGSSARLSVKHSAADAERRD